MKLSIVTINLNNADGLRKTIDSVCSQTWRDFEWIIIDGGSIDSSVSLIKETANKPEANVSYYCSEPDQGIYYALNEGARHAKGEYISFLNAGDCYHTDHVLESVFGQGQKYDEDILYGNAEYHYLKETMQRVYPASVGLDYFLAGKNINHQTTFIRRSVQMEFPYQEKMFRISGDYAFFMHCCFESKSFRHLDLTIADFDATGISQNNPFIVWSENHTARELEVTARYLNPSAQEVYRTLMHRRFNKRILLGVCRILNKLFR